MNKVLKIIFSFVFIFIFGGCLGTTILPKPNEKVFEEEDTYILFALRAEQLKDYKTALKFFHVLYKKSPKKEYFYKELQTSLILGENAQVIAKINEYLEDNPQDFLLIRMKIIALIQLEKLESAKENALQLVALSQEEEDYILVSDIYVKQKKFNIAVKYLEAAYTKNYSEKILDKIAIILYLNLQRKKDAIAQLETHLMIHGNSKIICNRLLGFYSNDNNIDGLVSTYLKLYAIDKKPEIAKKIIQIYRFQQEHIKLMNFLEESNSDDKILLDIYTSFKNYKKAAQLAQKLYLQTAEVYYLGQSAIFQYESSNNKDNATLLFEVINKLKKAIELDSTPLYLNYLGYLMIDHDIDIKEGIAYVNKALSDNQNSAFYLDSLAWGYYKLNKCKEASNLMKRIRNLEGGDELEVIDHEKKINECLKIQKGRK